MKTVFYFEFYDRTSGFLEHNGEYETVEEAFKDAKGRIAICAGYREAFKGANGRIAICTGYRMELKDDSTNR